MTDMLQTTASLNIPAVSGMAAEALAEALADAPTTITTTDLVLSAAATTTAQIKTQAEHLHVRLSP